jgi:hypothetical protein
MLAFFRLDVLMVRGGLIPLNSLALLNALVRALIGNCVVWHRISV